MPFDSTNFVETKPQHDLTTPRGRLEYLRDVVVPGIPVGELDLSVVDCGTVACLCGWARRNPALRNEGIGLSTYMQIACDGHFFSLTISQGSYLFLCDRYSGTTPTHAELTAHINDVLSGRVK